MSKTKRGQAALEFLMTYGWAFLVIMIMIGALAYFGVLNPQQFLPDRCKMGSPILCQGEQYVINSVGNDLSGDDATIRAKFVNNFGQNVKLKNFSVSTDYSNVCEDPTSDMAVCLDKDDSGACNSGERLEPGSGNTVEWEAGESHDFIVECQNAGDNLAAGDKVKFSIEGMWWTTDSEEKYSKPVEGEIYATVQ